MINYVINFNQGYNFHNCCGSREIGAFHVDFGDFRDGKFVGTPTQKTKEAYENDFRAIMRNNNKGSLIATTIKTPTGTRASSRTVLGPWVLINKMLKDTGWKKVAEYVNPNTRNTVLVWHFS
jgi:hypothetical protein